MRSSGESGSGYGRLRVVESLKPNALRVGTVLLVVLLGGISCYRDESVIAPGAWLPVPVAMAQLPPEDSLTHVLLELEPQVAPVMEAIQRARMELRAHSDSQMADSAFVRFFRELDATVREVAQGFDGPAFQALLLPEGREAQMLRREDPDRGTPTPGDRERAESLTTFLVARGIWPQTAEGSIYFVANEAILLEHLGPYLSPALQEFLRQREHEQVHPVADDGALMIPPGDLAERAIWAEHFLEVHAGSVVHNIVASRLDWYIATYIGGLPNTRPFDTPTGVVRPDWRRSFETIASEHGDSAVGRAVSEYLILLERSDFTRSAETNAFLERMWDGVRLLRFP